MKKLLKKIKDNIDTIWIVIYVATLFVLIIMAGTRWGFYCLDKVVEKKDYYVNFLWPSIFPYVAAGLGISTLATGFVYSEYLVDDSPKVNGRDELIIKNISHITTAISNLSFIVVKLACLKCISWLSLYLLAVAIFAIICFVSNVKSYRESNDKSKIEEIWQPATLRITLIMMAIVGGIIILGGGFKKGLADAKSNFLAVNSDKIELSFGHLQGFEDNRAIAKVEFVNMYGSSGRQYSMEQLEQEYTNFKTGKGSWSNLWLFSEESVNIELKSQIIGIDYDNYPYIEEHGELGKYYFDEESYNDDYRTRVEDKLYDVKFFLICVEQDLNSKGLTLSQINDSSGADAVDRNIDKRDYISATSEQVIEACRNFAKLREPLDGDVAQPENLENLELTFNMGIGSKLQDAQIEVDDAFTISHIKWQYEKSNGELEEADKTYRLEKGDIFAVSFEVNVPYIYQVDDYIKATVSGVECDLIYVQKSKEDYNKLEVQLIFTAEVENGLTVNAVEFGLKVMAPDELVADIETIDKSVFCDSEYVGWQVYDIHTGTASDYEEETFSGDNLCYIAVVEITPDDFTSFENVDEILFGDGIKVGEYDENLHKYKSGAYPKAYFVKSNEAGEDKIIAYIPYYMAETTGVDGDLWNTYVEGNYVYLPEHVAMKFRDRPKLGYEAYDYQVTDYNGNLVEVHVNLMDKKRFSMPAYPVIVTGYFE